MTATTPLAICVGEVLWDALPNGRVLGGAPANVAWHARELGLDARLLSAVGDDEPGREARKQLADLGLDGQDLATVPGKPTGIAQASLDAHGNASYTFLADAAWDHLEATPAALARARRAAAMNFGGLAQRGQKSRDAVRALLDATPASCLRVFDLNLRPPHIDPDVLAGGFERSTLVKMNEDELPTVARLFGWPEPPEDFADALAARYPGVVDLVVTAGGKGASWRGPDGTWRSAPASPARVVDTVGAGDAFTAAVIAGLLGGMERGAVLEAALRVAAFVCGRAGATPRLPEDLRRMFVAA